VLQPVRETMIREARDQAVPALDDMPTGLSLVP
jgi:hypothetical protein